MTTALDALFAAAAGQQVGDLTARHTPDYRIDQFVLDPLNRSVRAADIGSAILDGELELTIEGASTLTLDVADPDLDLLTGDLLTGWTWGRNADTGDAKAWIRDGRPVDAVLDDIWFRLVQVEFDDDRVKLTLEDRIVAYLREHKGAKKAIRGKVTRARFVKMLCDEAGVPSHIPDIDVAQPIARGSARDREENRRARAGKGIPKTAKLRGKGDFLTPTQLRNAELSLDQAETDAAPELAKLALLCGEIVEAPDFDNPVGGEGTSSGILQLTSDKLGGSTSTNGGRRDIPLVVHLFLTKGFYGKGGAIALARKHPDWTPGRIAQQVQGSAFPDRYDQYADQAAKILEAYGGVSDEGLLTKEVNKKYPFARGRNENSWDCQGRLAEEVGRRRFSRQNVLWYVSEEHLFFGQKPQLEVERGKNGVESIKGVIDIGAKDLVAELTVEAFADRWTALPGMVATVKGRGPADGRWLVTNITPDLFGTELATITLKKPIPEKAEPAPDTVSRTVRTRSPILDAGAIASGSPKEIIDTVVLPIAAAHGIRLTPADVVEANARHGTTKGGGRSDHQGPPKTAWAVDMSNGSSPTPQMDALAAELADTFNIHWTGSGIVSRVHKGYRYQLIYRINTAQAGNHFNHVHFGVRRTDAPDSPGGSGGIPQGSPGRPN